MRKQVWEITESDLKKHPIWVFPMLEDEDTDEATVQPASELEAIDLNTQIIVASNFTDKNGNQYFGYMYWCKPIRLEDNQPLLWINGTPTNLWFGMQKPSKNETLNLEFPLKGKTIVFKNLESIEIEINGYGYIDGNEVNYINS